MSRLRAFDTAAQVRALQAAARAMDATLDHQRVAAIAPSILARLEGLARLRAVDLGAEEMAVNLPDWLSRRV